MKTLIQATLMSLILSSCAHWTPAERKPAQTQTCKELAESIFIKSDYEKDLKIVLSEKKLIGLSNKLITINYPPIDWINKVRVSLNKSIRNWNNNRYPAFYLSHEEDIVPHAKKYLESISQVLNNGAQINEEISANFDLVNAWIKNFENYQKDIDNLLDERISLQYNLSLLKKLKLADGESRDIKLIFKRNGETVEEIITFHQDDKNLSFKIKELQNEIRDFDGTILKNGKIKDRLIRQAMLKDVVTIVHREMEAPIKNAKNINSEVLNEFQRIGLLLKKSEFDPGTYGLFKVTNKIFLNEVANLTGLDVLYTSIKEPLVKLKNVFTNFFKTKTGENLPVAEEKARIGLFKTIYNKISNITYTQLATGAGVTGAVGYGFNRYFLISAHTSPAPDGEDDGAHLEQLEQSEDVLKKESNSHSKVIEVSIDEVTGVVTPVK